MRSTLLTTGITCALGAVVADASAQTRATLYVPSQYPTIQAAVDAAANGDTILVDDGVYAGATVAGKSLTIRAVHGPRRTVVQGSGFWFSEGDYYTDTYITLDGFTIRDCNESGIVCMIWGEGDIGDLWPVILNCVVTNNSAGGWTDNSGGGIALDSDSPMPTGHIKDPVVRNCIIADNTASYVGGGVLIAWPAVSGIIDLGGCTITGNHAGYRGGGIGVFVLGPTYLENSIVWGNTAPARRQIYKGDSSILYVTYTDVQGGWTGTGNINADPLFAFEHHLSAGSPCIDAGDPNYAPPAGETDIDGEPRRIDGDGDGVARVDMGADEYHPLGDMDGDLAVNFDDIDVLVYALLHTEDEFRAAFPEGYYWAADCNLDGAVTVDDIDPFVEILSETEGPERSRA